MAKVTIKETTVEKKDAAKVWLNVGVTNDKGMLVNVPYGIPLYEVKGNYPSQRLQNQLNKIGMELEPGETTKVSMIVTIHRTSEEANESAQLFDIKVGE